MNILRRSLSETNALWEGYEFSCFLQSCLREEKEKEKEIDFYYLLIPLMKDGYADMDGEIIYFDDIGNLRDFYFLFFIENKKYKAIMHKIYRKDEEYENQKNYAKQKSEETEVKFKELMEAAGWPKMNEKGQYVN